MSTNSPVSLNTSTVACGIEGSPIPWYTSLLVKVVASHTFEARWKTSSLPSLSRATPDTCPSFTEASGQSLTHCGAVRTWKMIIFSRVTCTGLDTLTEIQWA